MGIPKKCYFLMMLDALGIFVSWIIYGTFYRPSELALTTYLKLRGGEGVRISIRRHIGGRNDVYVYCGNIAHSPRVFAGIPNVVSIVGGFDEIDVKSLNLSPNLHTLRIGNALLINHECLVQYDHLINVGGCIEAPFENSILIKRNQKWHLTIRMTEDNMEKIFGLKESQYYDLEINESLFRKLSKDRLEQLRRSRYRYINRRLKDVLFEETHDSGVANP